MLVRSMMSVLTGFVIWGFALLAGLELATAWGVIAFVLNYIPFIGPLVATVFPTLFALAQFESWQLALVVFSGLNLIQFLIGSYLEPQNRGCDAVRFAIPRVVRGVLLDLPVGHPGRLHRRADRDRHPDGVRAARIPRDGSPR